MDSHLNGGDPRTYKSKFEWEIFFSSLFVEAEGSNTTNAADRNTINPTMQSSSHESGVNPGPHQASASTSTASSVSSSINTTPNNHEHKFWTIFFCHFSILDSSKDSSDLIFFFLNDSIFCFWLSTLTISLNENISLKTKKHCSRRLIWVALDCWRVFHSVCWLRWVSICTLDKITFFRSSGNDIRKSISSYV